MAMTKRSAWLTAYEGSRFGRFAGSNLASVLRKHPLALLSLAMSGLLVLFFTWSWIGHQRVLRDRVGTDRVPQSWSLDELARAAADEDEVVADARILTWQIREDDRPLYVESAIVWLRLEGSGRERWMLAHVFRHPREFRSWKLSGVFDVPYAPRRMFDYPPKNAEVYQFLRATWWEFGPDFLYGFRLVDAAVCAEAWKAVIGQEPTEKYIDSDIKSLAVAMRDYVGEKGTLPPAAVYGKDGRPLLSWRVLILPYLDQLALFKQFKLDESWDSTHNEPLLASMPRVYAPPDKMKTAEPYSTYFQVFVGKGAAFDGTQGVSLEDFPDGIGETILIVEASEAVPWTKPDDLPYAVDRPLPRLGMVSKDYFTAAFGDARVHHIGRKASEKKLRALITRNADDNPGANWEWTGRGSNDP
jgi:hypothetical protein